MIQLNLVKFKGQMIFPFSLYGSSVTSNPAMSDLSGFSDKFTSDKPCIKILMVTFQMYRCKVHLQKNLLVVEAYRHVMTNFTPDNEQPETEGERLEGWRLTGSTDALDLVNVDPTNPKSVYFRDEYAKRPVNIKNIKQLTSSAETQDQFTDASGVAKIGNYTNDYEIILTNGRSLNNKYLIESDGLLPETSQESTAVSGVFDFAIPRRDLTGSNKAIIVNRFSAPGDPSTMTEGFLDIAAAEFSVYNAIPFRNLDVKASLTRILFKSYKSVWII